MPKRVLVIRIGRLGDTILATPIIQALQQTCGEDVIIDFAVSPGACTIALFGPTNPDLTGPYPGKVPCRVLTGGVDCQPCFQTPLQKKCSFNRCMQELSPELVFAELERLISQDPATKIPGLLKTQG